MEIRSFTTLSTGLVNRLTNEVRIGFPFEPSEISKQNINITRVYTGLYDTGATNSVITKQVVDECGFKSIGLTQINTASGIELSPTYIISLWLPNGVCFSQLKVCLGNLTSDIGALIGMDIINRGDFIINNMGGATSFSFRIPSLERVDYTKEAPRITHKPDIPKRSKRGKRATKK